MKTIRCIHNLILAINVLTGCGGNIQKLPLGDSTLHAGTVHFHRAMKAEGLKERDVVVWLPDAYNQNTEQRFPVLYMQDGQNLFDVKTSYGYEWRLDEICDSLIKAGAIDPLIIVGMCNTEDRMREYIPGKLGERYMAFLVNTVKPFIDSTYRTNPGREHAYVGGASAGGTISFMLAWEYSEVFSKAICMSPALKVGGQYEIDFVNRVALYEGPKNESVFYLDNGGLGVDTLLQPGIDAMIQTLQVKGYQEQEDYFWIKDATANHNEVAWSKRFPGALKLLFQKSQVN